LGYVGFRSIVDRHRNDIALVLPATAWSWQIAGAPGLAVEFSNGKESDHSNRHAMQH
jgi:hypothetical protein